MRVFYLPLLLALAGPVRAEVAEPAGLFNGPIHGETPKTLAGAKVIDADATARLKEQGALLIDVAETPRKPDKVASGATSDIPWTPIHYTIPGAVWLANAGSGDPDPAWQERFSARISALTGGDKQKPVVSFCHPRCWGSWNAAKRLVMLGYAHVYWFPGGVEGWQEKFPAATVKEDAAWNENKR